MRDLRSEAAGTPKTSVRLADRCQGCVLVKGRSPYLWTTAPWSPCTSSSRRWKALTVTRPHRGCDRDRSCVRSATTLSMHHQQGTAVLRGEQDGGAPPGRGASCQL